MEAVSVPGAIKTPYSPIPCGIRKTIPFQFAFDTIDEFEINFLIAVQQKNIDSVQSVYVNNVSNTQDLTITVMGTSQVLVIPAASCAFLPIIAREEPVLRFSVPAPNANDAASVNVNNFPVPAIVWTP